MKRLFTIASIAFLSLAALVSCNKESFQEPEILKPHGEKITISASIADMTTKTNYEDVNGMLKTTWSANDSISVLTIGTNDDGYQILLAVDNFHSTCAEGSDMADFTGTLTEVTGNNIMRVCHYPALNHVREDWGGYISDCYLNYYPGTNNTMLESYEVDDFLWGKSTCFYTASMPGMNLKDYLKKADIMTGLLSGDATSGYSVSLKKQTYVLKLELDLSEIVGSTFSWFNLNFDSKPFACNSGGYDLTIDSEGNYIYTTVPAGDWGDSSQIPIPGGLTVPEDGKVVLYATSAYEFSVNQGANITIEAVKDGTEENNWIEQTLASVTKTLKSDLVFEKGNIYTLKATLVSPTSGSEPEMVDLGLSVKWATCNLGASSPEEYGLYYQWGDTQGYGSDTSDGKEFIWGSYKWFNGQPGEAGNDGNMTKYKYTGAVLEPEDDAAHVALGGKWRMPTSDELEELKDEGNCSWTWTTLNGVNGYKVQSLKEGYTSNWIFLPYAGHRNSDIIEDYESGYWSSTLYQEYYKAMSIEFNNPDNDDPHIDFLADERFRGLSIRPVFEKRNQEGD